ncbi:MAG: hypothetical protein KAR20_21585, partial [Candidatus Heimdallarchaeota archaeon]|nr:hypothetical protein [Candidatus Heimdallarchaeota archaeon]
MKKIFVLVFALIFCVAFAGIVIAEYDFEDEYEEFKGKQAKFVDGVFGVYYDRGNRQNHFVPAGWMGDFGDIKMNERFEDNPHSGKTCIKFTYTAQGKQGANWCGVFWQ